jgi:hypothetical protein
MARHHYALHLVGVAIVLAGIFVALRPRVAEFLTVSSCLDHGGSYDYARWNCDHVKNHPYIPWSKRSHDDGPVLAGGGLVFGGLVVLVLGEWTRRRKPR